MKWRPHPNWCCRAAAYQSSLTMSYCRISLRSMFLSLMCCSLFVGYLPPTTFLLSYLSSFQLRQFPAKWNLNRVKMRRRRQRRRMCHKQAHRLDGTRYPNTTINCDEEKNDTMRISKTTTVRQASTKWKWTWRNDAIYDVAKCWMQYSLVSLKSSWLSIIIHIRRRDYADTLVSQYIYSLNYNKLTNKSANYYTYEPQPTITPMSHNPHEEIFTWLALLLLSSFIHLIPPYLHLQEITPFWNHRKNGVVVDYAY